jgi:hypothetical protein
MGRLTRNLSADAVGGLAWQDNYKYTRLFGYDSCSDGSIPKPPVRMKNPEPPAISV